MSLPYIFDLPVATTVEEDHDILVYQDGKLKKVNSKDIFYNKTEVKNKILDPKSDIIKSLQNIGIEIENNASLETILSSMENIDMLEIGIRRMVHDGSDTSIIPTPASAVNNPRFTYMGKPQSAVSLDRCIRVGKSTIIIPAIGVSNRSSQNDFLYAGISSGDILDRNDFYGGEYTKSLIWKNGIYPWNSMEKVTDSVGNVFTRCPLYYIKTEFLTEDGVNISSTWPKIPAQFISSIIYEYTFVCKTKLSGYRPASCFIKYDPRTMTEDENGEYIYLSDIDCYKKVSSNQYPNETRYRISSVPLEITNYIKILDSYHDFGCYEASVSTINNISSCLVSMPNKLPLTNMNINTFRNLLKNTERAINNGNTQLIHNYYLRDIRSYNDFFCTLFDIEFATTDSQKIVTGRVGYDNTSGSGAPFNPNYKVQENATNTNTIKVNCKGFKIGHYINIGTSVSSIDIASKRLVTDYIDNGDNTYTITFNGSPVTVTTSSIVWEGSARSGSTDISEYRTAKADSGKYSTFKWNWIENLFGNISKFIDGVHIIHEKDPDDENLWVNNIYTCDNTYKFSSIENDSNYNKLNYIMPSMWIANADASKYVIQLGIDLNYPWVRLPSKVANYGTGYNDQYSENSKKGLLNTSGNRVLISSGTWNYGDNSGLRLFDICSNINYTGFHVGSCFEKYEE